VAFSRIDASLNRVRAKQQVLSSAFLNPKENMYNAGVPADEMRAAVQTAAAACTEICRSFIRANMDAQGMHSRAISAGIARSVATYGERKGVVMFQLPGGNGRRSGDKRPDALYKQNAALNYGWFAGESHLGKSSKKRMKAILEKQGVQRAFANKHHVPGVGWVAHEGGPLQLGGGVRVVQGKHYWQFSPAQRSDIKRIFRQKLAVILMEKGHGNVQYESRA
jgi:hypothetical protein